MKIETHNLLVEKAKTRKDGVYSYQNILFAVMNNNFVAFAETNGECYECMGMFNVRIGRVERYERKKSLTQWLQAKKSN